MIFTALLFSIYNNSDTITSYYCAILKKALSIKLIYLTILFFIVGFCSGYIFNTILKSKLFKLFNAYQKRHETTQINQDNDKARIATLEAKIATLEVALDSALKNK